MRISTYTRENKYTWSMEYFKNTETEMLKTLLEENISLGYPHQKSINYV